MERRMRFVREDLEELVGHTNPRIAYVASNLLRQLVLEEEE